LRTLSALRSFVPGGSVCWKKREGFVLRLPSPRKVESTR